MDYIDAFWSALMWISGFVILGWAILKIIGVIHSPVWIQVVPYLGGGAGILSAAYYLGKMKKGIKETENKVNKILDIEERFNKVENEHKLAMNGKLKH